MPSLSFAAGNLLRNGLRAWHTLTPGAAVVLLVSAALVGSAATNTPPRSTQHPAALPVAPADTDSVALQTPADANSAAPNASGDSTAPALGDSTTAASADSTLPADSLQRVRRYLSALYDPRLPGTDTLFVPAADVVPQQRSSWFPTPGSWKHETRMDSASRFYTVREHVGEQNVRGSVRLDSTTYRQHRLQTSIQQNWRSLVQRREQQRARESGRSGLGLNIAVPGGRQSAFSTIFGKPQVDLRVNGQAQIRAGFNYRYSDQQVDVIGEASSVDPEFKQDLRLGITGTIGDKLRVNVNWDTNNQFDYQNQLKLDYTGYEDEILQNVEAGNVFLRSPSTLISSGQKLFGIKSEFQFGNVHLTTVASQEEGQSNSLSIEGGAQEQTFDLDPTEYDERKHFFLAYFFRNAWERTVQDPTQLNQQNNFGEIRNIEVWRMQQTNVEDETRNVAAIVDLGEEGSESGVPILQDPHNYTRTVLPNPAVDQYSAQELDNNVRPGDAQPKTFLENQNLDPSSDFQVSGSFKRLQPQDYTLHERLGYISLRQSLQESQALAVAFEYQTTDGRVIQVGDFISDAPGSDGSQNEDNLVLKLLRPRNLQQPSTTDAAAAWYLEMRNIYTLPGSGLNPRAFNLNLLYEPSGGTPQSTLPDLSTQQTLLQLLGLDRVNSNGQPSPDDAFDYTPWRVNQSQGRIIFPYLEPFGARLADAIEQEGGNEELKQRYVFQDLYSKKKANAKRNTNQNVYRIKGSFKGSQPSFYDLGAFSGIVEGSVRVTSDGTELQEGQDYVVDYQSGTVTITNQDYLQPGRRVKIDYEQNKAFNIQKKTLLGARADYALGDKLALGATAMRLSEKSPVDKFRIGEEPISNSIIGIDGSLSLEPRWLTWAVDALPFVQTKAQSIIDVTGEIAQLRPGHSETNAFERSRSALQDDDRDFKPDELDGISYIDDFEGFENTFELGNPGQWHLAAAPLSVNDQTPDESSGLADDQARANWRATTAWYKLNRNTTGQLDEETNLTQVTQLVPQDRIFPSKPCNQEPCLIEPFDVYFNPHSRGPYNYTKELKTFLNNPEDAWGGVSLNLPEGYNDFNTKNIEFVEFVFRPYYEDGGSGGGDPKLYLDLGSISEDVIPNQKLNEEDGLDMNNLSDADLDLYSLSRLPGSSQDESLDLRDESPRRTEDLGLDGLASIRAEDYEGLSENTVYRDFLDALPNDCTTDRCRLEVARAQHDPSGDDYHNYLSNFFNNSTLYPDGASVQERFSRYFAGQEFNGYQTQDELGPGDERGNARYPDSEDLTNNGLDTDNSYYQYELPLSKNKLDQLADNQDPNDYVISEIKNNNQGTGWYLIRIPVRNFTKNVGDKQDFSLIESIRMWTTGHTTPVTMRFASMELVGSQWRKSDEVARHAGADLPPFPTPPGTDPSRVSISSINNQENQGTYAVPNGTVRNRTRSATGGRSQLAREQSLVMRVEYLRPQQQRALFKTYNQGLDLLKYQNLRMFVHMHGQLGARDLTTIPEEAREKIKLFVRLGANQTNDYYEYEQPLSPSRPEIPAGEASMQNKDDLWQTYQPTEQGERIDLNSVNIELSALNRLKFERDNSTTPRDSLFWSHAPDRPEAVLPTDFAPPGTRIGIKGNPSLDQIETVVIGIRHDAPIGEETLRRVEVWLNELRVAGYDQDNGWAALANANFKLADLGRVRGNFRRQTAGFGSLSSTLDDRRQVNQLNWSVTTDLNADKFIPTRYGWRIPISLQLSSNTSTPEFAPSRGDIRVQEIIDQLDSPEAKQGALRAAQTHRFDRSLSVRVSKNGSDSPWLRKTLDALSVNYSYSDHTARNPQRQLDNSWQWDSSLRYQLNVQPHTLELFSFLDGVPVLQALADVAWNYVPNAFTFSGRASRNYNASKDRPRPNATISLPPSVRYQRRDQQKFTHSRNSTLQYNPFDFLNLSFDTNTNQSLDRAGIDTLYSVVRVDSATGEPADVLSDITKNQARREGLIGQGSGYIGYERDSLNLASTGRALNRIFSDKGALYTQRHGQNFSVTLRPNISSVSWLDWVNLQDISYRVNYDWNNGPIGRETGANVSNSTNLKTGLTLNPLKLLRKFEFYRQLEQEQEQEEAQRQQERQPEQTPSEDVPVDSVSTDSLQQQPQGPSWIETLLPSPRSLLRGTVLALTDIQNLNITYSSNQRSSSSNVGHPTYENGQLTEVSDAYSLLGALQGDAPPLGYRFGFDRRLDPSSGFRVIDSTLQVQDRLSDGHNLTGRGTLSPSDNLQISLNWNTEWNRNASTTFNRAGASGCTASFETRCIQRTTNSDGTNRTSTWTFGGSYLDMFKRQLQTYRDDLNAANASPDTLRDADDNGRILLTDQSVLADFRKAFSTSFGPVDSRGLFPFPMPNWTITYSGMSQWPILQNIMQNATLQHVYNATYQADYRSELRSGEEDAFTIANQTIAYTVPSFRTSALNVNERFQPLIGLEISWKGNVQTSISWNKNNSYSLNTGNRTISESKTNKINFNASYRKQGLTLPFLPFEELSNTIRFSLSASYSLNDKRRYLLQPALEQATQDPFNYDLDQALTEGDNVSVLASSTRLTVTPEITYRFSNRVSADFSLQYEKLSSEKNQPPSSTTLNGGFNVRVSISN